MTKKPNIISRIFLTPAELRLRAGWRILVMFILLLAFLILTSPILVVTTLVNVDVDMVLFLSSLVSAICYTAAVFLSRYFIDRRSIVSLGLPIHKKMIWDFLFGVCLSACLMLFIFLVMSATGWLEWNGVSFGKIPINEIVVKVGIAVLTFFLVGWGEELLMRGYLMLNIRDGINLVWGVILSSLIFSFAHATNPGYNWQAMVGLFLAGLFFAFAALRSKGLWLPIGLHIGWNFFEGTFFGFSVSGLETFRLIQPSLQGPNLWTGGSFGPEAGIIIIPTLLIGACGIYFYTRLKKNE
jgi:uncharacterized protein